MRICPTCNSYLYSNDHYYCSTCGNVLPAELVNKEVPIRIKVEKAELVADKFRSKVQTGKNVAANHFFNKTNSKIYALALLILFIGLFINRITAYIYHTSMISQKNGQTARQSSSSVAPAQQTNDTVTATLQLGSGDLTTSPVLAYIPAKVDFLLVIYDSKQLLNLLKDQFKMNQEAVNAASFLINGSTAGFVKGSSWGIIVPVNNAVLAKTFLKTLDEKNLNYSDVEDAVVFYSDPATLKDIKDAKNKTALNVSLTPDFVNNKVKLADPGKIMYMSFNTNGATVFNNMVSGFPDSLLKNALVKGLKSGYNEFIIQ